MLIITLSAMALWLLSPVFRPRLAQDASHTETSPPSPLIPEPEETSPLSDFEKAVEIIKKYEGLHQPKHYPLVGYGHQVLKGEKFSRTKAMSEADAEALLRKDLLKNCAVFRDFGADSLLLGVLAYNIGSGVTMRSSVVKKLKAGDRDIYSSYVAHCRYKGKVHSQIQRRRIEEFETLFSPAADTASDQHPDSFPSLRGGGNPSEALAHYITKIDQIKYAPSCQPNS